MKNWNWILDDAIARDELEEVKAALASGADLEYRDPLGWTPLINAAWIGSVRLVEYLVSLGADPAARSLKEGLTALEIVLDGANDIDHREVIHLLDRLAGNPLRIFPA